MTKENSITIIIPTYNTAKYLPRCFAGILSQTYQNFEVIIIDDGSTDNTEEVVTSYLEQNSNFRYIKQKNGGPGVARNTGIENALGEWTTFIDADDYVEKNYLETLLNFALQNNLEVSSCGCVIENPDLSFRGEASNPRKDTVTYTGQLYEDLLGGSMYAGVVTMKLIKTYLLKGVPFPPIKYGEDSLFLARIAVHAVIVGFTPFLGYHYVRIDESATMNKAVRESVIHLDHVWVWAEIYHHRLAMRPRGIEVLMGMYAKTIWQAMTSLAAEDNRAVYDEKEAFFRENIAVCVDDPSPCIQAEHRALMKQYLESPAACWNSMKQ